MELADSNTETTPTNEPDEDTEEIEDTIEYLFKDYKGGSFITVLIDHGGPVGDEKW